MACVHWPLVNMQYTFTYALNPPSPKSCYSGVIVCVGRSMKETALFVRDKMDGGNRQMVK